MTTLTSKMKQDAKNAAQIEGLSFKYSPAYDVNDFEATKPKSHRVMCKGNKTKNKWVWLGATDEPHEFESEKQAKLFIKEIKSQIKQEA